MPSLALFLHEQIARIGRTLASATPIQRMPVPPPAPTRNVQHGFVTTYRHLGCRCGRCRMANLSYGRRWRASRRNEVP